MVRIKLVMDKRRKLKSGCFPIKLKFTVNQKVWYKNIGINLKPKYWNVNSSQLKRNCPNWNIINLHLQQVLVQHLKEVIECSHKRNSSEGRDRSLAHFKKYVALGVPSYNLTLLGGLL